MLLPLLSILAAVTLTDLQTQKIATRRGAPAPLPLKNSAPAPVQEVEPPPAAPVLRTTYDLWLKGFFSAAILNDPTQEATKWGRQADPDQDGALNYLEYFSGKSPVQPSGVTAPQIVLTTTGGQTYQQLSFLRRKALSDPNILQEIITTSDLTTSPWTVAAVEVLSVTTPADLTNPIETVTCRLLAPLVAGTPRFARLRLTPLLVDSDADGLADAIESNNHFFNGAAAPGTNASNSDTDGDKILDGDETLGTLAGLNLPQMGCNPLRRNILLEYDWFDDSLDCTLHTHRPNQNALDRVAVAFAGSGTSNPDDTFGITVIQDRGDGGIFTGGNLIPATSAAANIPGGVSDSTFLGYKVGNFGSNRNGYFHYVLMPHRYNSTSTSSGQAEINGDDLIVSLYCAYSDGNVANTIMHELGHNLGLRHGGNVDCNYKPNYNSVMNYRYQFPGVNTNCMIPGSGVLDYSRGVRIPLNENALNENNGVCGSPAIDFNANGTIQTSVAFDLNSSDSSQASSCGGTLTTLLDYNDWANLIFSGVGDSDGMRPHAVEIIDCNNPAPQ